jgi:hypothetical protein
VAIVGLSGTLAIIAFAPAFLTVAAVVIGCLM